MMSIGYRLRFVDEGTLELPAISDAEAVKAADAHINASWVLSGLIDKGVRIAQLERPDGTSLKTYGGPGGP